LFFAKINNNQLREAKAQETSRLAFLFFASNSCLLYTWLFYTGTPRARRRREVEEVPLER